MRVLLTIVALLCALLALHVRGGVPAPASTLMITEIVDGPTLPSGTPKWVEISNSETAGVRVDLAGFTIGVMNAGEMSLLTGQSYRVNGGAIGEDELIPGESWVIAFEPLPGADGLTGFEQVYGVPPNWIISDITFNGDDTILLYEGPQSGMGGIPVDVYGVPGEDGTDELWDIRDGYARRKLDSPRVTEPNPLFDVEEWDVFGEGSLEPGDGGETELQLLQELTTPFEHFVLTPIQPTASPSASPSPTASPTPTASPSASPSPTPTPTASPSPTPTPTPTASPSPSPTPTASPSPSPTPTPTASPSPSPTPTSSPSPTPTASPSPTPTASPSPSASPTPLPPLPSRVLPSALKRCGRDIIVCTYQIEDFIGNANRRPELECSPPYCVGCVQCSVVGSGVDALGGRLP